MSTEVKPKSIIPPYISYISFQNFIKSLSQGVPSQIDRSVMKTMSGAAQSQMKQTFRFLKLTDAYGNATAKLEELAESTGSERQQLLNGLIRSGYYFLFEDSFNLERATMIQVEDKFRQAGANGETVRKCVSFFLNMAKEAGINLFILNQAVPKSISGTKPRIQRPRTRTTKAKATSNGASSSPETPSHSTPPGPATWTQQLLDKFPTFDPSWPNEVKAQWFESFRQLMHITNERPSDVGEDYVEEVAMAA